LRCLIILVILLTFCSSLHADGLSGSAILDFNSSEQFEDNKKTSASDAFNQNYYLNITKSVTSLISYQFNLRTRLSDSDLTDSEDNTTKTYLRAVEPSIDLLLRNPIYNLRTGYRRTDQWSTASLEHESRKTNEFSYSHLNVVPLALPSLSLEINRTKDYDRLPVQETDRTRTTYSGSSSYELPAEDMKLQYYLTYTRNVNETPIDIINKSIDTSFVGAYDIGYPVTFWSGKAVLSADYQGNYVRHENKQFVTQKGNVIFERTPYFGGLYIQDATPETDALNSEPLLIN
jgi:hypothetical protein